MKYFDPRALLFAPHGQHIVLVHFPVALLISSVVLDLIGRRPRRGVLASAASINLYAAAITAPLAAATGLIAWRWQLEGARLRGALLLHLLGAVIVVMLCGALAWFRLHHARRGEATLPFVYHAVGIAACVLIAATAHLGGIVSGVVTLPN